ncbi:homoserine kinase type II [Kribbella steppae]|uniref:Homoserine kinase type II n=1 Tax=Kribbella steppae TaxID=2512223 RepID=A0A4R2HT88_9ACTN|nr:phosphotransferase [Kribbella steppae]TCO34593.1 homoserine kinase type II [Kribbella steppae]
MDVAELLAERWGRKATRVARLPGGMGSTTWLAEGDEWRVVVKAVDASDEGFGPGLELAARLGDAGFVTGRPVPSNARRLVEAYDGRWVGVLEFVDGVPLTDADAAAVGELLGRVHQESRTAEGDVAEWLQFLRVFESSLDLEEWIRPAVEGAMEGVRRLGPLTWGWLHGDPSPEAFMRLQDGATALIDWGAAMHGPVLYDVASAVMYVNGPGSVVPAYLKERPELRDEVEAGLDAFLQVRYAVQAGYFAWRCSNDVRTGIADPAENRKGLADARRAFGL